MNIYQSDTYRKTSASYILKMSQGFEGPVVLQICFCSLFPVAAGIKSVSTIYITQSQGNEIVMAH